MIKNNQGFTLTECLTVVFIAGILVAISAPSFLGMYYRAKLNAAENQVRGALQEAQRQAMRKSQICQVKLDPTSVTNASSTNPCLLSTRDLPQGIQLTSNVSNDIQFNFRGGTSSARTVVLAVNNNFIPDKKCIVISMGIGIMRAGDYNGTLDSISANDCTTS